MQQSEASAKRTSVNQTIGRISLLVFGPKGKRTSTSTSTLQGTNRPGPKHSNSKAHGQQESFAHRALDGPFFGAGPGTCNTTPSSATRAQTKSQIEKASIGHLVRRGKNGLGVSALTGAGPSKPPGRGWRPWSSQPLLFVKRADGIDSTSSRGSSSGGSGGGG